MRFCMVTTFYPPYHIGGDATYVRALGRALVARGHEVDVIHCEDAFNIVGGVRKSMMTSDDGITVHRLKSRFGALSPLLTQQTGHPGLKAHALHEILDQAFDVVNFHNISLVGGPAILAYSKAPVTLYTLHEHWLVCQTHILWKNRQKGCDARTCLRCTVRSGIPPQIWRYTGLIRRSLQHVDAIIAASDFTADQHRQQRLPAPIHKLPLFSTLDPGEPPAFRPSARARFLFVGRVTASKGIVPLVEFFARHPEFELAVIGDGDQRRPLADRFADNDNILFPGWVPQAELVAHYRQASALILSSLAPETFGLTVVEALACGTPVIVRNTGGSPEIVAATGAGFVYDNDEELETAVRILASDPALRQTLGQRAYSEFRRLYTVDTHLEHYLNLINSL